MTPLKRGSDRSAGRVGRLPRLLAVTAAVLAAAQVVGSPETPATGRGLGRDREARRASILVYHRFGPTVSDRMTVRTTTFRWQLQYLRNRGYRVIPLRSLVEHFVKHDALPLPHAVAITADDGHRSIVTEMAPLAREYGVPVTLFVYPSAVSRASYAVTWEDLERLRRTGLFDIQSHTYWHPNFTIEKRRLDETAYRAFARTQLRRSRSIIAQSLGANVDLLAWPFGIYDADLLTWARECGYVAGVGLGGRSVADADPIMALPRYLVTDGDVGSHFAAMLPEEAP